MNGDSVRTYTAIFDRHFELLQKRSDKERNEISAGLEKDGHFLKKIFVPDLMSIRYY